MNERDLKRAIDSIQQAPGMEMRVHRAVIQHARDGERNKNRKKHTLLQGSVIAAACCAVAAVAVVITSFQIGSLGGGFVVNTPSLDQRCPGAPGQQPGEVSNRVEVTLSRSSGIPVSEGISFSATVTGKNAERLSPEVQVDRGSFTPDGGVGGKTISGTWRLPLGETQDEQRFVASVTAMEDGKAQGKSQYLIATYHKDTGTLSVKVSDSPDG